MSKDFNSDGLFAAENADGKASIATHFVMAGFQQINQTWNECLVVQDLREEDFVVHVTHGRCLLVLALSDRFRTPTEPWPLWLASFRY